MPDAELLRALQPLLEPREIAVVTQALGLDDELMALTEIPYLCSPKFPR